MVVDEHIQPRDDVGLASAHADVRRRVPDYELLFDFAGVLLRQRRGNDASGRYQLHLAGEERRDGSVVVIEAADAGVLGRDPGEIGVLDRAAGHADGLAREIGGGFHLYFRVSEYAGEKRRIGAGERDRFGAVWSHSQAGDHQIHLARLQVGNAIDARYGNQLEFHAKLFGHQPRNVHIVAFQLAVLAGRAEGRKVLRHGNLDDARLKDVLQLVGDRRG